MCRDVEGRFLEEQTVAALQVAVARAEAEGIGAVFLATGRLGDAITLAAALAAAPASPHAGTPPVMLGVRTNLTRSPHRHPTVLAREMTALDLISKGRALLAFTPPLGGEVGEAIALGRHMWRDGIAASDGPHYPVAGAINRPRPHQDGGPRVALDLTDGTRPDTALVEAADLLLVRAGSTGYPPGVELCQIQLR
jgi:alkanesulfonate monooxygenase SsuD/methylene tetrahydromethanopterin reductase-like flavin-dependent oxidoreductase (luciferase family)